MRASTEVEFCFGLGNLLRVLSLTLPDVSTLIYKASVALQATGLCAQNAFTALMAAESGKPHIQLKCAALLAQLTKSVHRQLEVLNSLQYSEDPV